MTIDKAIEILKLLNFKTIRLLSRDEMAAVKLGIEALKRVQYTRDLASEYDVPLLLSETKD